MRFSAKIRYWNPDKSGGLAVADVPSKLIESLGGLKQMKVRGKIKGVQYQSNVMPAGKGRLSLSVSQKMMKAAGVGIGETVEFEIERITPA